MTLASDRKPRRPAAGTREAEKAMSYDPHHADTKICDGCLEPKPIIIEVYWARGNRHYCQKCWPFRRDYYESDEGRRTWKRTDSYYAPVD